MKERVLISAGEVSGDLHAAGLISELKKIKPDLEFFGLGGNLMRAQGVKILHPVDQMAFLGFWEVVKRLRFIHQVRKNILNEVDAESCRMAILVDYPGFNLHLAEELNQRKIPVIYYISPQIWAWGKSRIKKIKKIIDLMLVFFPFEEALYQKHSVRVKFVGHPLVQLAHPQLSKEEFYKSLNIKPEQMLIGLLPGSRTQEIGKHLPTMLKASHMFRQKYPLSRFLIALAPGLDSKEVENIIPSELPVRVLSGRTYEIMSYSELLLVKSGTSTLETALCGTPFVVMYKTSLLSYLIARRIVKISQVAMVNILAEKEVVPEFIQNEARPQRIAGEMLDIIENRVRYNKIKQELSLIREKLESENAYALAAQALTEFI